jgi:hypothetical protein
MFHVRKRQGRFLVGLVTVGALAVAVSAEAGNDPPRPMKGACSTTFSIQPSGAISIAGTCNLTHLGTASYQATQTVVPNADGTVHITVTGFYTAANGDVLRSTLVGTGRFTGPSSVSYTTTETYAGGTGRFADASGVATDVGVASFTGATTGTSSYTTTGTIAY